MEFDQEIRELIDRAIAEDIQDGDITAKACISDEAITSGRIFLKQSGVLAGLPYLAVIFQKIDPNIQVELYVNEGSFHKTGTIIGKVTGPARGILTGERVALNFIQHCSGIATITNEYARKIAGLNCMILDTRKTLPGMRSLEKYAVKVGGGTNHRLGLADRFIIKNNHLAFIGGPSRQLIPEAVRRAKALRPDLPIEIEIQDLDLLDDALKTDVVAIILNNMTPHEIERAVKKIRRTNKKAYVESSKAITKDTIRSYAETGVDGISLKDLTSSVKELNIGMRITP